MELAHTTYDDQWMDSLILTFLFPIALSVRWVGSNFLSTHLSGRLFLAFSVGHGLFLCCDLVRWAQFSGLAGQIECTILDPVFSEGGLVGCIEL